MLLFLVTNLIHITTWAARSTLVSICWLIVNSSHRLLLCFDSCPKECSCREGAQQMMSGRLGGGGAWPARRAGGLWGSASALSPSRHPQ